MAFHLLLYLLIILWFYFYIWRRRQFYKIFFQMPGPWGLPFIGVGFQLLKPEQFLQRLEIISKKYKTPFISWLGPKCFLYVNDPATVETIFNSPHCVNKGEFYDFLRQAIGDGLFTSKIPRWNKHRRLLNPIFKRSAINNLLPIFNHQADLFIENLFIKQQQQQSFDLYELLKKNILQTSFVTTMGETMNFHKNNDKSSFILNAYNGITEVCVTRMLRPWLYSNFIYHLSNLYKKQKIFSNILQKFVENLLKKSSPSTSMSVSMNSICHLNDDDNKKYADKSNRKHGSKSINDLKHDKNFVTTLDTKPLGFIQQMHDYIDQQLLTWQDVRDEANVIVAATFETTSTALYFVCLCLAMHPEYQQKLYHELLDIFTKCNDDDNDDDHHDKTENNLHKLYQIEGHKQQIDITNKAKQIIQKASVSMNGRGDFDDGAYRILHDHKYQPIAKYITIEQLKRMEYTEMVINEAMRLFAPVPIVLREATESFQLNNGCVIPKGTQIAIDIFNMQRNENVWGIWAKQFQPERHFSKISAHSETIVKGAIQAGAEFQKISSASASASASASFAFIPFTKGLRMCIGYRYAMILMKVMLAKIFSNFQLLTNTHLDELKVKGTISLKLQEYPLFKVQQQKKQQQGQQ